MRATASLRAYSASLSVGHSTTAITASSSRPNGESRSCASCCIGVPRCFRFACIEQSDPLDDLSQPTTWHVDVSASRRFGARAEVTGCFQPEAVSIAASMTYSLGY